MVWVGLGWVGSSQVSVLFGNSTAAAAAVSVLDLTDGKQSQPKRKASRLGLLLSTRWSLGRSRVN